MAIQSLSSIIEPTSFTNYVNEQISVKSALIASGAMVTSDVLNQLVAGPSKSAHLPHFNQFTWAAPKIAKDDSTAISPDSLTTGEQIAQKDFLAESWATAALTNSVVGEDVLGHVANETVVPYWVQSYQQLVLSKLSGVVKDNVANDSGDMVKNVATDAVGAPAAAELANVSNFTEAFATMGDAYGKLAVIVMHSRVFFNLLKAEPTNTIPASATQPFPSYLGLPVIIDDSMPAVAGSNRTTYTTYILGKGSILLGEGTPELGATQLVVDQKAGNGYGTEELVTRKKLIIHPAGFASSATVASNYGSPTLGAYDTAAAWNRVMSRKNCPIVAFKTNG